MSVIAVRDDGAQLLDNGTVVDEDGAVVGVRVDPESVLSRGGWVLCDAEPRDGSGRWTSESKSDRIARAKATHKPSTRAKQQRADANEAELARKIGAERTGDNKPMDVIVGGRHGVELKTMLDNGNDKITMHPPSRRRKEAWAREKKGRTLHTVVFDDRPGSEHRIYYARGVGAFRLKNMEKVKSFAELRKRIR